MTTLAYQGTESKQSVLDRLQEHRRLDQLIKGQYWEDGKGCAVACLTHADNGGHDQFPARWGIPVQIAYLIDTIFEALPTEDAMEWPVRVMSAIPEGADLSKVWDRYASWMLHDLATLNGVDPSVGVIAGLFDRAVAGDEPTPQEWEQAAQATQAAQAARVARIAWAARDAWDAWAVRAAWDAWDAWAVRDAWAASVKDSADMLVEILSTSPV